MQRALVLVLLLGAVIDPCRAQPFDWSRAQSLTIELSNFRFQPATLSLDHGAPYRLHFVNTARGAHNFVAKAFFASSTIAPDDRVKLSNGGVDLEGGESVDIRLVPNQPGSYKSHCSHFMHSVFGMTGKVVVR